MDEGQRTSFLQGTETHAYRFMGCHRELRDGKQGYVFRVWAPHARSVHVVGTFNGWDPAALPMERLDGGIFEAFSTEAAELDTYKYYIETQDGRGLW